MIVSRARTHYMSTHYVTLQVLLPFRVLSRNPSSFHSDKPESTDDVTNEEFEKALTWKIVEAKWAVTWKHENVRKDTVYRS